MDQVELPNGHGGTERLGCDGPFRIGVVHWTRVPGHAQRIRADGLTDSLALGFRPGRDRVAQLWWDRRHGLFSARDVAVLTMIAPAVQRLVRDAATPALPRP